jgi:glycosyltransferase involved in cell wall biosynthesis
MGEELTIIRKPATVTSPTLRDLLAVLFRQRRLVLLSFMAIFVSVLGYGVFAPSYQAHMNVLVRRGRADPLVTPAPTPSPMFQRDEITEEELNSQVELLRDDEILRTVVQSSEVATAPWYGAGVCVLASDIPENRELVHGSGFTFRPGDRADLERMLRLLIAEPEIRRAAASKARERVWEHYLWGRVAREIEGSYLRLAGGNAPKPAAPAEATGYNPRAA